MEKPIYFGIAVYEEPYCGSSIEDGWFQGSSAEEVEQKLTTWIEQNVKWNQEKANYHTIVWVLHPDGRVSLTTD